MLPKRLRTWAVLLGGLFVVAAQAQVAVRKQGFVPFSDAPIDYLSDLLSDPVTKLQQRIDRGETTLAYEPRNGYLKSVLDQLDIPVSSQALVFSKTSFQFRKISPSTPRALYFNDDVYVGWVHDGKALEIVSFDPRQGAIFYIVDEHKPGPAKFERAELDCTQCHVTAATRGIPGVLVRSIHANPNGTQAFEAPSYIIGHHSPFAERFGGWYVTGTHGRQRHMGNATVKAGDRPELDRAAGANVVSLSDRLDTSPYPTPHSDIVAQLVLAHQTQTHNLITLTNYRTRIALHEEAARNRAAGRSADALSAATRRQIEETAEELVKYLLFVDEAPLSDPIAGTSTFAAEFQARGPRDARGRSLRDFDLTKRLFKHPCSYLIYSESFDALPEPAKTYVYRRLLDVLSGRDRSPAYARLTRSDRRAVLDILLETKPGLPDAWRTARSPVTAAAHRRAALHPPTFRKDQSQ